MNTINMPGFTAEAALLESRKAYSMSRISYTEHDIAVLPQAPKNPKNPQNDLCKSKCTSTLLGDTVGCATAKYPEICKMNANNVYNRCNTRCDNVYTRTDVVIFPPGTGGVLTEVRQDAVSCANRILTLCTNRDTDFAEKFFVRVDVTEEFPFMVTRLPPYFYR